MCKNKVTKTKQDYIQGSRICFFRPNAAGAAASAAASAAALVFITVFTVVTRMAAAEAAAVAAAPSAAPSGASVSEENKSWTLSKSHVVF